MSLAARPAPSEGWFPVTGVARFALTGADRVRYLNGQVSNDVRKLADGRAMRACVLSAKGKLDGVVWMWPDGDSIIVEVESVLEADLRARLERYIVADDVEVHEFPPVRCAHVIGAAIERIPADLRARAIARLGTPGIDVEVADFPVATIGAEMLTPDALEWIRIENAEPKWGGELGPDTLPAEAGLDRGAVDFHKGCYIGQEVVSRIESVGHANRALRVFDLLEGPAPKARDEFFRSGESTKAAAVVTSVSFALSPAIGLCYIRRGTPEAEVLESPRTGARIQLRSCATPS